MLTDIASKGQATDALKRKQAGQCMNRYLNQIQRHASGKNPESTYTPVNTILYL